jgi:hypothetical protein
MNIELKVSAKQSDINSSVLQRLRRVTNFLAGDDIDVKITFGDDEPPQKEEPIDPTIDLYPLLTEAILIASKGIKQAV